MELHRVVDLPSVELLYLQRFSSYSTSQPSTSPARQVHLIESSCRLVCLVKTSKAGACHHETRSTKPRDSQRRTIALANHLIHGQDSRKILYYHDTWRVRHISSATYRQSTKSCSLAAKALFFLIPQPCLDSFHIILFLFAHNIYHLIGNTYILDLSLIHI